MRILRVKEMRLMYDRDWPVEIILTNTVELCE
jgi:hypothetical protein